MNKFSIHKEEGISESKELFKNAIHEEQQRLRTEIFELDIDRTYSKIVENMAKDIAEDITGIRNDSTKLVLIAPENKVRYWEILGLRGKDADTQAEVSGGKFETLSNTIAIFLTPGQADAIKDTERKNLPVVPIISGVHELAHAYGHTEYNVTKNGDELDIYNERDGLSATFDTNLLPEDEEPKIGHFLEELFAYNLEQIALERFREKLNTSITTQHEPILVAARQALYQLSEISETSSTDILKLMAKAVMDPNKNEQDLREVLEISTPELYDRLLTRKVDYSDPISWVNSFRNINEIFA